MNTRMARPWSDGRACGAAQLVITEPDYCEA